MATTQMALEASPDIYTLFMRGFGNAVGHGTVNFTFRHVYYIWDGYTFAV
jgi:hypothetical protein